MKRFIMIITAEVACRVASLAVVVSSNTVRKKTKNQISGHSIHSSWGGSKDRRSINPRRESNKRQSINSS